MPKYDRLTSVYGKPLVGDRSLIEKALRKVKALVGDRSLIEKALRKVKASVITRIRHQLLRSPFSDRAKEAFSRAIKVEVKGSSLSIMSSHPALVHFLKGRKKQQMTWLVKAAAPIPIFTESGLIFRSATARSMADGKWVHPGKDRYDFVERVKQEAKQAVKESMLREIRGIFKGKK